MKTLNELKEMKKEYEMKLQMITGNSKLARQGRAYLKDCIEKLEFAIWKQEEPEGYESHKQAITDYCLYTHII